MKTNSLTLAWVAFFLAGALSEAASAVPVRVKVALGIEAPEVQAHFGPTGSKALADAFYAGALSRIKPILEYWHFVQDSPASLPLEASPSYLMVFRVFQGVPGTRTTELLLAVELRKDGNKIEEWPPIVWRPFNDEKGFGPPDELASELVTYFGKLLYSHRFSFPRIFQKQVPIGIGAQWMGPNHLGLDLPRQPYGKLKNSGFKVHAKKDRRLCQLQCNGLGFAPCSKNQECLTAEPVCCIFEGNKSYLPNQVADLKDFTYNEIFFAGIPKDSWPYFEPRQCK